MYNKENIMSDLYSALEKLRYPEVAEINLEEFESAILTGNKRVQLLYWLLQENKNFNATLLNKFKESSLEGKLLKCYSQMGFCNSEDVLLGKCKIDEQLHFLSLLTLFIKRIHSAESEFLKTDTKTTNSSLKQDFVNTSPSINCGDEQKSNIKSESVSHNDSKSLDLSRNVISKQSCDFESMCSNIKSILEESNTHQNDNYEPILQKFYTSFKNVTSLTVQNSDSNQFNYKDINTDIEKIHNTFSTINKTLINEIEFNNRLVPENNEKTTKPLSSVISNNVVLIEQACNMLKENRMLS